MLAGTLWLSAAMNSFDFASQASTLPFQIAGVVLGIAVPALILNALDDPFIRLLPETRARIKANPNITLIETEHGGHCAFLAQPNGYDGRWAERQTINFFCHHGMA